MKEIAAGGVVYRYTPTGKTKIMLIRDRFGKVSLAKGRQEQGETVDQTALREVMEETSIRGEIVAPLRVINYQYHDATRGQIDKEVHYYLIEATEGQLKAQVEEIADVDWYTPSEAWQAQKNNGYDNNDIVLKLALEKLGVSVQ